MKSNFYYTDIFNHKEFLKKLGLDFIFNVTHYNNVENKLVLDLKHNCIRSNHIISFKEIKKKMNFEDNIFRIDYIFDTKLFFVEFKK